MGRLLWTENTPFDLSSWINISFESVYAGTGCVMAITRAGRVLRKTPRAKEVTGPRLPLFLRQNLPQRPRDEETAVPWDRVRRISLSASVPDLAVGLTEDGTCVVSEKALRDFCDGSYRSDAVKREVSSWRNIVQAEASDAFFALDDRGTVHAACPDRRQEAEYAEVLSWRNVARISVHTQNAVFGITADGHVLCAGSNLRRGPHGDLRDRLMKLERVTDICATGSECEEIVYTRDDGRVFALGRDACLPAEAMHAAGPDASVRILAGHFQHAVYALTPDRRLVQCLGEEEYPVFGQTRGITSFAAGDMDYSEPFVIAVAEG